MFLTWPNKKLLSLCWFPPDYYSNIFLIGEIWTTYGRKAHVLTLGSKLNPPCACLLVWGSGIKVPVFGGLYPWPP